MYQIREATTNDAKPLAKLITELGYPTTYHQMLTRFNHIYAHSDYKTYLAYLNDETVGMIGLTKSYFLIVFKNPMLTTPIYFSSILPFFALFKDFHLLF
jgi:hypothetical protein